MLSVIYTECCKQAHYAKCHYAECSYAECCGAAPWVETGGKGSVLQDFLVPFYYFGPKTYCALFYQHFHTFLLFSRMAYPARFSKEGMSVCKNTLAYFPKTLTMSPEF
jgi:hypothetical protein